MEINHLHEWDLSPEKAIAVQKELAPRVIYDRPISADSVSLIAGVDVSVKDDESQAAVVVLTFPDLKVVETSLARLPTSFPYVPGLLTFREGPVLEIAFGQLKSEPDVFIFDGMGRAHPRRMGIAAHMGLWLQRPSIGCGKTLFVGKYDEPPIEGGNHTPLVDRGEVIGAVVRTKTKVKPVYISPGHLIDLESSVNLILRCTTKYRLPEPIRAAHMAAGKFE
jgi:deoxyribonuclease V